jgi:hypothetical protein
LSTVRTDDRNLSSWMSIPKSWTSKLNIHCSRSRSNFHGCGCLFTSHSVLWNHILFKMASGDLLASEDSLYPIAVLIDELRNEDVQVYPALNDYDWFLIVQWQFHTVVDRQQAPASVCVSSLIAQQTKSGISLQFTESSNFQTFTVRCVMCHLHNFDVDQFKKFLLKQNQLLQTFTKIRLSRWENVLSWTELKWHTQFCISGDWGLLDTWTFRLDTSFPIRGADSDSKGWVWLWRA